MRKSLLLSSLLALAVLFLLAIPAQAEHRHRRGRVVIDSPQVIVIAPGTSYYHHPPGWSHGRKVGWGYCDQPPGLAKKYGCRSTFFGRHRHFDRRSDRRFHRRSGVVIHLPGRLYLDLR